MEMEIRVAFRCNECGLEEEFDCLGGQEVYDALNCTSSSITSFCIQYEICRDCTLKITDYALRNRHEVPYGNTERRKNE